MSRISYQVAFERDDLVSPAFAALAGDAIDTRKRDAKVRISVDLSKRQARWLKTVNANAGAGDADAVIRALLDLAMELHIDWSAINKPADLRDAVRAAVLIRHHA